MAISIAICVPLIIILLFCRCGRPFRRKTALLRAFWNRDGDAP